MAIAFPEFSVTRAYTRVALSGELTSCIRLSAKFDLTGKLEARVDFLCKLTEQEAIALLEREGCTYQVTSRDGRRLVQVRDYKPNRVNLDIVDGRVDSYGLG